MDNKIKNVNNINNKSSINNFYRVYFDNSTMDEENPLARKEIMIPKILCNVAKYGSIEQMQVLLDNGFDVNYKIDNSLKCVYDRPICAAIESEKYEMVNYLIKHGADIGNEPYDVMKSTVANILNTFNKDKNIKEIIVEKIQWDLFGDSEKVKKVFKSKDIGKFSPFDLYNLKKSPIALAFYVGNEKIIKLLFDNGAEFGDYFYLSIFALALKNFETKDMKGQVKYNKLLKLAFSNKDIVDFDDKVRPQDDFEQYINGKWRQNCKSDCFDFSEKINDNALKDCRLFLTSSSYKEKAQNSQYLFRKYMKLDMNKEIAYINEFIERIKSKKSLKTLYKYIYNSKRSPNVMPVCLSFIHDSDYSLRLIFTPKILTNEDITNCTYFDILPYEGLTKLDFKKFIKTYNFLINGLSFDLLAYVEKAKNNNITYSSIKRKLKDFDYDKYLNDLHIPDDTKILISTKEINELVNKWNSLKVSDIKNYICCRYVLNNFSILMRDKNAGFSNNTKNFYVDDFLNTSKLLVKNELNTIFAQRYYNYGFVDELNEIFSTIKHAYSKLISTDNNLKNNEKLHLLNKISNIKLDCHYEFIEKFDSFFHDSSCYSELIEDAENEYYKHILKCFLNNNNIDIIKPEAWYPNAYYSSITNCIYITPSYLQPPNYLQEWDISIKFSTIGFTMAHEIGHALDLLKTKNYVRKKLIKQFDSLMPRQLRKDKKDFCVDGKLTINENFSDLAGIEVSLYSLAIYKNCKCVKELIDIGKESIIQYFEGYALRWRKKYSHELILNALRDVHAPNEFRVNTIKNLDAFHEVYNTKRGDGMWLQKNDRVHIFNI